MIATVESLIAIATAEALLTADPDWLVAWNVDDVDVIFRRDYSFRQLVHLQGASVPLDLTLGQPSTTFWLTRLSAACYQQ